MLSQAILFAVNAHKNQTRKGSDKPYIIHPVEAALIISQLTDNQDAIVAGLLHDTLEDTSTTEEELATLFGQNVLDYVKNMSEDKSKTWLERKAHTLKELPHLSYEDKCIALGDKLANARALKVDYATLGEALWTRFNVKEKHLHGWYYKGLVTALEALSGQAPYEEFKKIVNELFGDNLPNDTVDLHTHSTASDGSLSPTLLIGTAKQSNLKAIAVTDHDTMTGIPEALEAGQLFGVEVIPGVEISSQFESKEVHILGYYVDPTYQPLIQQLEQIQNDRIQRNNEIVSKLQACGFNITIEDLLALDADGGVITRAHVARVLLNKKYVSDIQEAFDLYLGPGKPAFVDKKALDYKETIRLIHDAGGMAVIAHPYLYKMKEQEFQLFIEKLVDAGIDGIECIYSTFNRQETENLLRACQKYHLLATGGSDFHGLSNPKIKLGVGLGHLHIPYNIVKCLKSK